ncbi:MAG: serine protease [Acholeplasmataceae bacterium]|nr:serine protease [Acholeplasmataceae bacterium]
MKKAFIGTFTGIAILTVSLVTLVLVDHFKSPKEIFNKNIQSIVEVISTTNEFESYGTAVVINNQGELITNYHVVSYTQNNEKYIHEVILIRLSTQETYIEVEVTKFDEYNDLAIIKIIDSEQYSEFKPIELGNSDDLSIGDVCYAIGNAGNLSISMSQGIIGSPSIKLVIDDEEKTYIQSDISITSGSSGGALVDEWGKLIGITTLRLKDNTGAVIYGYGYSIAVNQIKQFLGS